MSRGVHFPDIDYEEFVLPRSSGGTGVHTLTKAAESIGVISNSNKNVANGVAGLNANDKVEISVLPINPDVNWVNVSGPFRLIANGIYNYVITDFDSFKNYTVSCSNGVISRIGDTITYIANANLGAHTFTVNGRVFDFTIQIPAPDKPSITSPVPNANVLTTSYTLTGSAFSEFGDNATHLSSDWQIATDAAFTAIAFSTNNDTTNKTSWTVNALVDGVAYFARLRYRATNTNTSEWSDTVNFTVAVPVPVTPVISSPVNNATEVSTQPTITSNAFTTLDDGSTHVSSDWQIATDTGFTNVVKSTNADAVNKTTWSVTGLSPLTNYFTRVRYRSSNGKVSAYSSTRSFTTANVYVFTSSIAINTLNYNVATRAIAAGWDGILPLIADITVNNGVAVGSNSISTYAFDSGTSLPNGSKITLNNNGLIIGKGGDGNGGNGGSALRTVIPTTITNNGTIGGGGGAGGAGGGGYFVASTKGGGSYGGTSMGGGGGGGQGYNGGAGGPMQGSGSGPYAYYGGGSGGGAGGVSSAGGGGSGSAGHAGYVAPNTYIYGGTGGSGGGLGVPGAGGNLAYWSGQNYGSGNVGQGGSVWSTSSSSPAPTSGGVAGKATVGNSNITWLVTGTRLGALT